MATSKRVGILSRTLNSNTTIQWIVPARIRSRLRNDVVLVGTTCITLREFLPNGQLADPVAQLDFDTQILAVTVISAQLQIIPILDAILNQERDELRYEVDGKPLDDTQPPQILVLSTAAAELLYVYAKDKIPGKARFIFARRPLLGPANTLDRSGRHLAVDSESRAIAVTPSSNTFAVFQLKNVEAIKSEIDQWHHKVPDSFKPIKEQRYLQVDGRILKMSFLKSPPQDPDKIVVLLLVARAGTTRILLYQWSSRGPLQQMRSMRTSGEILPPQDSFPLLLIPSSRYTSFFLVTETSIVLYDNVHTDQSERREDVSRISKSGTSSSRPLWVQWAKPARHKIYMDGHDDFILVREDGLVRSHLITHKTAIRFETSIDYGGLGIKVDTAFCMLAGPAALGGDTIIIGGDGVDGGVFNVQARQHPAQTQRLPNISRPRDMIIVEPSVRSASTRALSGLQKHRLFIGVDDDLTGGAVAELKHAVEAPVVCNIAYPEVTSIDRLWILKPNDQNVLWLLLSHPFHTSVLLFEMETNDVRALDAQHFPGLDFEEATYATRLLDDQCVMQVTSHSLSLSHASLGNLRLSLTEGFGSECIFAYAPTDTNLLFTVHNSGAQYLLHMLTLPERSFDTTLATSQHIPLQDRPISMHFSKVGNIGLLLVGTETGILQAVVVPKDSDLYVAFRHDVRGLIGIPEATAISSVALLCHSSSRDGLIICGLRNGVLVLLKLKVIKSLNEYSFDLYSHSQQRIGMTAVQVASPTALIASSISTLISCQHILLRITLFTSKIGLDFEIFDVWFTHQSQPLQTQPLLHLVHQASNLSDELGSDLNGLIISTTDEGLVLASQSVQPQTLSRRLALKGRPRKMIYSRFLDQVVVASECHESVISPLHEMADESSDPFSPLPVLQMVDPNANRRIEDTADLGSLTLGEAGEHVRALINWSPTDGEVHFEMIVAALERYDPDIGRSTGRVMCLSAKHFGKGLLKTEKIKVVARYPGRIVTALCPFGQSSLVVAVDEQIILHHLDMTTRAWSVIARANIPSPAISVCTHGSLIYVTSHAHSLIVIERKDNQLELHQTDGRARTARYTVASADACFLTTASKNGTSLNGFGSRIPTVTSEICTAPIPSFVNEIRQYGIQETTNRYSLRFVACATDGGVYYFATLKYDEWRLLRYVESFCRLRRPQPLRNMYTDAYSASSPNRAERSKGNPTGRQKQLCRPVDMHIRGDFLQDLIDDGTDAFLLTLLNKPPKAKSGLNSVKLENGMHVKVQTLDTLARAVPAVCSDYSDEQELVCRIFMWIRQLLNRFDG